MSGDLSSEIKITADASGVEAGIGKAKRALSGLEDAAAKVGKNGGEGLEKIGAGGEASARKVEQATRNTIASIQRQIAAFEAGGTATRQYQESLARLRGVDVNALKPYLDQLDAAKAKAAEAAKAAQGLDGSVGGLASTASLAKSALAAMLGTLSVGAFVGFVRNVNDGLDALNDIKDATGSTIENISALEDIARRAGSGVDVVSTSLVKLNQVLADAKPGSQQEAAIRAIGLSAAELRAQDPAEALLSVATALSGYADDANKARLVQELFGKSLKEVAPFLNDLAEKGQLVATVTADQTAAAEQFNKQLANLQKSANDASRALVSGMLPGLNQVTNAIRDGAVEGGLLLGIYRGLAEFSSIAFGTDKLGKDMRQAKDAAAEMERLSNLMIGVQQTLERDPGNAAAQRRLANLRLQLEEVMRRANAASEAIKGVVGVSPAASSGPADSAPKPSLPELADPAAARAAEEAARRAGDALRREAEAQAKLIAELGGLSGSFAADWDNLAKLYAKGELGLEGLTQAQAALLAKQPAIKAGIDAEAKALEASAKAAQQAADARNKDTDAINEWLRAQDQAARQALESVTARVDAIQAEEQAVALASATNISLAEAVERVAIARLREKQAGFYEGSEGYEALQREIDAREKLANLVGSKEAREATARTAKEAAAEWQRTYEQVQQGLTNALMQGGKSGLDYVKGLFRTAAFRVVLDPVARPVASFITSMTAGTAAASGVEAGGPGLGSLATTASAAYNMLTTGVSNSITSAFSKFATSSVGTSLGLSTPAVVGNNPSAYVAPQLSSAGSAIGTGLGMAASGLAGYGISSAISNGYTTGGNTVNVIAGVASAFLGPVAGIVGGLINRAFGRKLKDTGIEGTLGGEAGFEGRGYQFYQGGWLRSDKTKYSEIDDGVQKALSTSFRAIQAQVGTFATTLGLNTSKIADFTTTLKVSTQGLDEAGVQAAFAEALATGSNELAQQVLGSWTQTSKDVTRVIQESGVSDAADAVFTTVTETITEATYTASEFARDGEKAIDTLSRLSSNITTVNGAFEILGLELFDVGLAGADAAGKLADALGGLDAFTTKFTAYYDAFYSEEEKRANVIAGITRTLRDVGAQVTEADIANATREQFRSIYESIVEVSGAADPVAVAMINVAQAFASVTQASEAARAAEEQRALEIRRSAQQIVDAQKRSLETLQIQLAQTQLQTRGGSVGGLMLSPGEVQAFAGFSDAISSATQALDQLTKLGLADELGAYADEIERVISSTRTLLATEVAKSRIRSGDVYGAIAVQSEASPLDYSMFGGQGGFNAGAFNAALAKQRAQVAAGLISYVSENALRVVDAGSSLGVLNSEVAQFERSLFQTTLQGFSSIVGGAATSALEEVARVLSSREAQKMIGGSIGLSRIMAASSAYAEASQTAFVGSRQVMGASAIAYATAIAELDRLLSTGRITVDQYQKSLGIVHDSVGDLSKQVLNLSGQMAAAAGAAGRLSEAGIEGVAYYFSDLSAIVGEMAQAAKEAATPLAQASESIGLLNSAAAAFGGSANAAINGAQNAMAGYLNAAEQARSDQLFNAIGGYEDSAVLWRASLAEMQRPGSQVSRAQLIAESASIASSILTTASAASAAEKLAENLTLGQGQSLRDLSLLVDGVGQYDNQAFYASFLRISDALGKGVIDEGQYQSLFEYMTESYQGVDQEAQALVSSMQSLRDAMRGFADQLLIDQQRTTLSPGATLQEMRRQYEQAFASASTGEADAVARYQGLATGLLDKGLYDSQAEYNAVFGRVYGDARRLEDIGISTLAGMQGNDMVNELKDMNAKLNQRVENLEKNLLTALAQIAKNTSDTSRGIEQQIVMAEENP